MPADMPTGSGAGARRGARRTLPFAALLVLLVVLAAGIGGTSRFTGARWFPKLSGSPPRTRTGIIVTPTVTLAGGGARAGHHGAFTVPLWLEIMLGLAVLAALAGVFWHLWRTRRLPATPQPHGATVSATLSPVVEPEPEPEPEKLLTGIGLALQVLDEQREPADAVVRAWLGLQETAEESGIVRHSSETPTEFTSRILSRAFTDDGALRTLLRLYLRTRFGDHPVTAADVTEVREALRQLLSTWQAAGGAPTAGGR